MANALMIGAAKVGMHFVVATPKELKPSQTFLDSLKEDLEMSKGKIEIETDPKKAVVDADIIYTDVWVSMGEEDKMEERISLLTPYQVNQELIEATNNPHVIFQHCLPAFHDNLTFIAQDVEKRFNLKEMEVTDEVFRGTHSVVFDEAENRMHTIKAVLVATMSDVL
jgi:ornithine carbamoyltransferase